MSVVEVELSKQNVVADESVKKCSREDTKNIEVEIYEDDIEDLDTETFKRYVKSLGGVACGITTVISGLIVNKNLTDPTLVKMGAISQETCNDITQYCVLIGGLSVVALSAITKSVYDVNNRNKPGELLCD
jgi:hypothetical protein